MNTGWWVHVKVRHPITLYSQHKNSSHYKVLILLLKKWMILRPLSNRHEICTLCRMSPENPEGRGKYEIDTTFPLHFRKIYLKLFHPVSTCSKFEWNHKAQVFVSWTSSNWTSWATTIRKLIENPLRNATEPLKDRPGRRRRLRGKTFVKISLDKARNHQIITKNGRAAEQLRNSK